ncbi:unnamed protein product, partial [Tetraodon nigroviridis]
MVPMTEGLRSGVGAVASCGDGRRRREEDRRNSTLAVTGALVEESSNPPLSSLRLLIPPLRLLTAAMWQVARRQSMKNLVMLEDFVFLVTEAVPQLLTDRQRSLLLLALRAKQPDEELDRCWAALMTLNRNLTEGPADRRRLLQEVFNCSFDSALQSLISDFLYKIEQLFPVPDFKQVIRHLRTNKPCAPTSTAAENVPTPPPPGRPEEAPPPQSPLLEPHPLKTHTCFQCDAVFRSDAELLVHQRSHRTRTVYQCDQCRKTFHHLSSLSNHKQAYLARGAFTCSRAEKETEPPPEPPRLQHHLACTVCHQTFSSQTLLLRHMQTHSAEGVEPRYSCRFCEQTFSGVTQLRIHQRSHTLRAYKCDQCSKTYSSLTGLNAHRANHANESRFLCPQCGKCFKTRDGLEGHLRRHSGERPYRCPHCPKDFTALAGLNVHVRRHTGERPYVCTICKKGWPSGGDLQKHMRTHTGERPYVCENCGKAFTLSCHLTEHRRIHTGETRAPPRGRSRKDRLRATIPLSTRFFLFVFFTFFVSPGEKPYSCPECGKCLRRKFDLKKHMLSHDSVRPYTCMYCSKSYTRKTHLNRHLLTHS